MLHLVGPGAAQCKRDVAMAGGIHFTSAYNGVQVLLTTTKYKHMGAMAQPTGRFLPEIRNRVGQAKAVLAQLGHVFRNASLEQGFRFQLVEALLDTRAFYGAATWPELSAPEQQVIAHYRALAFRNVLGFHNAGLDRADRVTDAEVLRKAAQVPTSTLLRVARLRYLRRLLLAGPPPLKAMAQQERGRGGGWPALVVDDLRWLREREADRFAALPDPAVVFAPWQLYIESSPGPWAAALARCIQRARADASRDARAEVRRGAPGISGGPLLQRRCLNTSTRACSATTWASRARRSFHTWPASTASGMRRGRW